MLRITEIKLPLITSAEAGHTDTEIRTALVKKLAINAADIVNDAMQFIPLADINLFLLRVNFSTYKQLNFINKLTHQGMIKNMVLVVNNAPFDKQLANKYSIKYFNEKQN